MHFLCTPVLFWILMQQNAVCLIGTPWWKKVCQQADAQLKLAPGLNWLCKDGAMGSIKNNLPRSQTPVSTYKPWAEFCHRGRTAHPSQTGISGPCEHTPLFLKSFQRWSSAKMSPFYSLPELLQKYDKVVAQSTLTRFLKRILNGQS